MPLGGQPFAVQIQVCQRKVHAQPIVVLCQAAVSHLVEDEDTLQDAQGMFHLGSDFRLYPVLAALVLVTKLLNLRTWSTTKPAYFAFQR